MVTEPLIVTLSVIFGRRVLSINLPDNLTEDHLHGILKAIQDRLVLMKKDPAA